MANNGKEHQQKDGHFSKEYPYYLLVDLFTYYYGHHGFTLTVQLLIRMMKKSNVVKQLRTFSKVQCGKNVLKFLKI